MLLNEEYLKDQLSTKTKEDQLELAKKLATVSINLNNTNSFVFQPFPSYNDFWENEKAYHNRRDLWNTISILRECFNELFKWEGVSKKQSRLIEEILFRNGRCAIVKLPEDEIFITNFVDENVKGEKYLQDIYGYPKKIRVISPKSLLDNAEFENTEENKKFQVIFNNTYRWGTLWLVWDRIESYINSLERVDVINRTSDVKVMMGDTSDDMIWEELNKKWYSLEPFIRVASDDLRAALKNGVITLADNSSTKMELNIFHLNNLLTLLGFRSADLNNKAERQTEMEVANNDKFGGMILRYMLSIREEASEEIKENLGLDIRIIEHDYLKDTTIEEEQEEGINGEENKNELEK